MNPDNLSIFCMPWGDDLDNDGSRSIFNSSKNEQKALCSTALKGVSSDFDHDDDSLCIQELIEDTEDTIWMQEYSGCSIRSEGPLNECAIFTHEIDGCSDGKRFNDFFFDIHEIMFADKTRRFLQENDEINEVENSEEFLDYFNDSIVVTKQRKKKSR
jgi:hypothetical protein